MNITIRKATIRDLQTLLDINHSSFEANATYDPYIDMNWVHTDDARKCFHEAIIKVGYYTIIAEADKKPVGFLILSPKHFTHRKVKMIELEILAVLPGYQCKHIGAALIAAAKTWAKEQGHQTIYATPYIRNERAVAFYKREGFIPIDISLEMTL